MTDRKLQILQTAAHLFKDKGYAAVTMRDLAAAMDMKAASLYNHISGKQEILSELILRVAQEFTAGMIAVKSNDKSAFEKVSFLIALHVEIAIKYTNELAVLNTDWMHLEGAPYEAYIKMRRDYETEFKALILLGVQRGEFEDRNVDTILFHLLSTLRSIYLWIPKKSAGEIAKLREELPELLLNGFTKRS
jgi:AcrR family transcriptional regulator